MTVHFFQRLSFKLTRASLITALSLGAVLTIVQVYLDFVQKSGHIDSKMEKILLVSSIPAQSAIEKLDYRLAREVVAGLTNYAFIQHVAIYDERNNIMADYKGPTSTSNTAWLTQLFSEEVSRYSTRLQLESTDAAGRLEFSINNDIALAQMYNRAGYLLVSGLVKNICLAFLLAILFNRMLTRPLSYLAKSFNALQREKQYGCIPHAHGHKNDELGQIVNAANNLMADLAQREKDLEQNEQQLRIILNASSSQIFALDEHGNFVFLNSATAEFYQRNIDQLKGSSFIATHSRLNKKQALQVYHKLSRHHTPRSADQAKQHALQYQFENTLTNAKGEDVVFQISSTPFTLYEKICTLVMCHDVTARVEAEDRVEKLALFDTLTHLPNKQQLEEKIKQDVQTSHQCRTFGALLYIDIDNFKRINDTMGHSMGDALLLKLSNRMQTQIRKSETLARLSGDEFILSVPNISEKSQQTIEQAKTLAERLLSCIRHPVQLDHHEIEVSASIGIALYPSKNKSVGKLLGDADTALHRAKKEGRDRYIVFEPSMSEEASRLINLESELRKALHHDQFIFFLQPLVDSHSWELVSAEALLRWQHPTRGLIPPGEFINFLENSPMMPKVGEIILNKVCGFIYSCRMRGVMHPSLRIAVNVSPQEFYQPNFVPMVKAALDRHHLHGSCLEFEITEGAALSHIDEAVLKMNELKELGITFALDDFGTGYSSLSYLKALPFDKIKIDQSFIRDITIDKQDSMLVTSVIAIGESFKLQVVAEGVETEDQANWLNFHTSAMHFQGYLFNKPLPLDEFERLYFPASPMQRLPSM